MNLFLWFKCSLKTELLCRIVHFRLRAVYHSVSFLLLLTVLKMSFCAQWVASIFILVFGVKWRHDVGFFRESRLLGIDKKAPVMTSYDVNKNNTVRSRLVRELSLQKLIRDSTGNFNSTYIDWVSLPVPSSSTSDHMRLGVSWPWPTCWPKFRLWRKHHISINNEFQDLIGTSPR